MPEDDRRDFHLYVDEFHNFTTDSFAAILAEARKYRLCLTLANQCTAQLAAAVRDAVFGNVGTLVSFRVGESDAKVISWELGGGYSAGHVAGLRNHAVCGKLLEGGANRTFTGRGLPPLEVPKGDRANLIRRSRERYATPRATVEDWVRRWTERHF